jgi:hypothetical protein
MYTRNEPERDKQTIMAECIQHKFKGMRYAVLGTFQGYLAQLPLQHRHLLFLTAIQQHSASLFRTFDIITDSQQSTLRLQRAAVDSFETTHSILSAAIQRYLQPIAHIMPTVVHLDVFASDIETQMSKTKDISAILKISMNLITPLASCVSCLLSLSFNVPKATNITINVILRALVANKTLKIQWALFCQIASFLLLRLGFVAFFAKPRHNASESRRVQGMARLQTQFKQWGDLSKAAKHFYSQPQTNHNAPPN